MSTTGKSFLFTVWEGGGNVPPTLAVARKLIAAGHHVRVMSDACNRPEAEAVGAEFIAWTHAPSRTDKLASSDVIADWEPSDPLEALGRVFERIMFGPSGDYARDVVTEVARARPDAIVTSEMLFGAMAGAEASRVPLVLFCPNVPLFPVEGVPPIGPGLTPARTDEERAMHAEISQGLAQIFNQGLPALNATRRSLELPELDHVLQQPAGAASILFGTARAFDFAPPALPPRHYYVAPQLHDTARIEDWTSPWPTDDTRPLAVLSFSTTFQNQGAALQRVIDAFAGLPLRLLVTLGPALNPKDFRTSDNVRLVTQAPHGVVMPEAALVIAHGGHGTVMRGLVNDRPLLVMPMGRDQTDNAVRVEARGAGLTLDPKTASTAEIRAAVLRLASEASFAENARRLGAEIRAEMEGSPVVALLEEAVGPVAAAA